MKKLIMLCVVLFGLGVLEAKETIKVITDRSDFHLNEIIETFNKKSEIDIEVFFTEKGLLERAKIGGYDIIISKNSSEIIAAKHMGLLKTIPSEIYKGINPAFKDPNAQWVNMSYRIRAIFVKKGFKNPPMNYSDLAKPEYKGKICIRKFTDNYNLDLFSTLYDDYGAEKFKVWIKAFNSNLARNPAGNDRSQVKAIYENECEIAIVNTYYMGVMLEDPEQKKWAESVDMIIPNQSKKTSGAIMIYSGIGIMNDSSNVTKVLKYLLSDEVQKELSVHNYEYPLNPKNTSETVIKYGSFQKLNNTTIQLHKNIQEELFNIRKTIYPIVKAH